MQIKDWLALPEDDDPDVTFTGPVFPRVSQRREHLALQRLAVEQLEAKADAP